ncbi:MAG: SBBP repeat-containing protein [Candidatus Lokiarchaeota archaeon]|nr:SBBP repeat-containing protein [Candidatus Lokiarchaeota archaeon]
MKFNKKKINYLLLCIVLFSSLLIFNTANFYTSNIIEKDLESTHIENQSQLKTSQSNNSGWITLWGNTNKLIGELGTDIINDETGNSYVVGTQSYYENSTKFLCFLKFNLNGTLIWERLWSNLTTNGGLDIVIDELNNTYIVGFLNNNTSDNFDVCILKYNSTGHLQWDEIWGGLQSDLATKIAINGTNEIYITGHTKSYGANNETDTFLLKYNSTGHLQWDEIWDNSNSDSGNGIIFDSLGDLYLTGSTNVTSGEELNPYLLKYNSSGTLISIKIWNELIGYLPTSMTNDTLNNLYIAGYLYIVDNVNVDTFLYKCDLSGNIEWNVTWGGSSMESLEDFIIDGNGNIYLTGYTNSYGGSTNIFLLKYNQTGIFQWYDILGDGSINVAFGIGVDSQDNIYLTGLTQLTRENAGNLFILKYDSNMVYFHSTGGIPGFDLYIIIGLFSIFTMSFVIIIIKKTRYKIN